MPSGARTALLPTEPRRPPTSADTQVEIILNLNIELSVISEWLKANRLTLNTARTKYVIFGSKQKSRDEPDLNLSINTNRKTNYDEIFGCTIG